VIHHLLYLEETFRKIRRKVIDVIDIIADFGGIALHHLLLEMLC
jgi:hypothetical protein